MKHTASVWASVWISATAGALLLGQSGIAMAETGGKKKAGDGKIAASPLGWAGEVTVGYIEKAGNTRSTSFNGKSRAIREGEIWRNTFKLEGANESAEDIRTDENYFAASQLDYKLGEDAYLFSLLEYTDDRFSGYDYEGSITFGYGHKLINEADQLWAVDAGLGYRRSEVELVDDTEEEAVVRLATRYKLNVTDTTVFEEEASTEIGQERTASKSLTRLKFSINASLWAALSYEIKHTTDAPLGLSQSDSGDTAAESKNSDRTTSIGLNYSF